MRALLIDDHALFCDEMRCQGERKTGSKGKGIGAIG
jgi:hypothetical protein